MGIFPYGKIPKNTSGRFFCKSEVRGVSSTGKSCRFVRRRCARCGGEVKTNALHASLGFIFCPFYLGFTSFSLRKCGHVGPTEAVGNPVRPSDKFCEKRSGQFLWSPLLFFSLQDRSSRGWIDDGVWCVGRPFGPDGARGGGHGAFIRQALLSTPRYVCCMCVCGAVCVCVCVCVYCCCHISIAFVALLFPCLPPSPYPFHLELSQPSIPDPAASYQPITSNYFHA